MRDLFYDTVFKNARLPARIKPGDLVHDTYGCESRPPRRRFFDTVPACSTPGAGNTGLAIDITVKRRGVDGEVVVTAYTSTLASTGRSAATRSENKKRRECAERVVDVNASLKDEGRVVWTPSFEFCGFGLNVLGALGKETQSIL